MHGSAERQPWGLKRTRCARRCPLSEYVRGFRVLRTMWFVPFAVSMPTPGAPPAQSIIAPREFILYILRGHLLTTVDTAHARTRHKSYTCTAVYIYIYTSDTCSLCYFLGHFHFTFSFKIAFTRPDRAPTILSVDSTCTCILDNRCAH